MKPVRTDCDGPVPNDLHSQIQACSAAGKRVLLFYCVPVHNNPTGYVLCSTHRHDIFCTYKHLYRATMLTGKTIPSQRRAALVSVCERAGVFLVADEVGTALACPDQECMCAAPGTRSTTTT